MKALERIANDITQTSDKRDFLLHLLEMFVQMGLQVRQLSEKAHRKVGLFYFTLPSCFSLILRLKNNYAALPVAPK